jgi:hypothetical protein
LKLMSRPAWLRRGRAAAVLGLLWGGGAQAADAPARLYQGEGGWVAVQGLGADEVLTDGAWAREGNLWIGRLTGDAEILRRPDVEKRELPLAAGFLPSARNAFGSCLIRSLSIRYESQIRARGWTLLFPLEDQPLEFRPLELAHDVKVPVRFLIEDVDRGELWELHPERSGREGGLFAQKKGDAQIYAGLLDEGQLEWHVMIVRGNEDRRIIQNRVIILEGPPRRLRFRMLVESGVEGVPLLQEELPPALVTWREGVAVGLMMDLAEPRRYRIIPDEDGWMGLEFDLALTPSTGNFPGSATLSLEADAWPAKDMDQALARAEEHLAVLGAKTALPEDVLNGNWSKVIQFEPATFTLSHPGGFPDDGDALHYLLMRMSGLFPDADWAASAFLCAALNAEGQTTIRRGGDTAVVLVNPDPDLRTPLEIGQNRGLTLLSRILRAEPAAVWIRALGSVSGLDHHSRSLYLCDYPAVWNEEDRSSIGVEVGHAEVELIFSLACVLRERGIALLVEDTGPLAPFTCAPADALVCRSSDPGEMRRQKTLAGGRPVFWIPEIPEPHAKALARELELIQLDGNSTR